ncbi:Ger(x)C family spore germination protein [Paenibacillus sp. HB172176]|uniref:Ger(x)C family spore germination protein n=1 Tax=Paenibacillus sp. HB172176 TaxID=2493690 RepID=UPI00143B8652|nr:Ger(x)C family spore germination protein [Paenibacillus sp. HB172176]
MRGKSKLLRWMVAGCCVLPLLSGCWDAKDVDNRLLVGAMGLEKTSESTLKVWLRFPLPSATQESTKKDFFVMSQSGRTVPDAINKMRYKLPKSVESSSTRALLLDESLAQSGLSPYLEFAVRERSIPLDAVVAVVKGKMERIFTVPNPTGELSGIYTKLFFEPYAGGIPRKNKTLLWEVYSKLYNPLHANLIPFLTEGSQNSFVLTGNAIFMQGKLVGQLNKEESLLYEIFTHRFHDSEVELMNRADVRILHNHMHMQTSLKNGKPLIQLHCSLVTTLVDRSSFQHQDVAGIVAELKSILSTNADSMFAKTQAKGADIFGFGNHFRDRLHPSEFDKWPDMFKNAEIKYTFYITMRNTGLEFLN